MKIVIVAVLLTLVACRGEDDSGSRARDGTPDGDGSSGSAKSYSLTGTVSNPFSTAQSGRLVAGIVPRALFVPPIKCSTFAAKDDRTAVTLPASYSLQGLVAGNYVLAALVIDGATAEAPFAAYGVTVESDGVHYNSPVPTSTIDLVIQGTVAYDCP